MLSLREEGDRRETLGRGVRWHRSIGILYGGVTRPCASVHVPNSDV